MVGNMELVASPSSYSCSRMEPDRMPGAISIYPPNDTCTNPNCGNPNPLKKEEQRQAVVYTLSDGVQPAWNVHLYCASKGLTP